MEVYNHVFIQRHNLHPFIIMQCNYIKIPTGTTATVYSDNMSSLHLQSLAGITAVILILCPPPPFQGHLQRQQWQQLS